MVYGLVSLVARTCCVFYCLKSVELIPGFSLSFYHSREIRVYACIQFNPVSYVSEELFCYGCLRTIFPFFLPFLCSFFCCFPVQRTLCNPLAVSSPLCVLELSRLTRIETAVKNTTIITYNIQGVSVYTNVSANYMFRPLLVRPSSVRIP